MSLLKVNGKDVEFAGADMPSTLTELLTELGVDAATVVAEVDGRIVERDSFENTQLQQGQSIELVRFVPGG